MSAVSDPSKGRVTMNRNDNLVPRLHVGAGPADGSAMCAMQVVSWISGDTVITDYPVCSARPLARLVQAFNDGLCDHRDGDLLCPPCSRVALDLGLSTVGTADVSREAVWAWLAEMLDSPVWGCAQHAGDARAVVVVAADLCRRAASGDVPSLAQWHEARSAAAAFAFAFAFATTATAATDYTAVTAARAAYAADAAVTSASSAVWVANVAAGAAGGDDARLQHARHAIAAWRRLAGIHDASVQPETITAALTQMAVTS